MHAVSYARLAAFYVAYFGFVGAVGPYFSLYLQSIGQTALGLILVAAAATMRSWCRTFILQPMERQ